MTSVEITQEPLILLWLIPPSARPKDSEFSLPFPNKRKMKNSAIIFLFFLSILLSGCSKKFIGCYSATTSGTVDKHEYIYVVETDSGFNFIGAVNYKLEKPILPLGSRYVSRFSGDTVEVKIQDGIEYASVFGEYHLNNRYRATAIKFENKDSSIYISSKLYLDDFGVIQATRMWLNLHFDSTRNNSTSISCEPIFENFGNFFSRDLNGLSYLDVVSTDSIKSHWSASKEFSMHTRLFEVKDISGFYVKEGRGYIFFDTQTGLFIEGFIDTQRMNLKTYTFEMVDFGYYRRHKYKKIVREIMSIDIETRGDNIWRQWNVSPY